MECSPEGVRRPLKRPFSLGLVLCLFAGLVMAEPYTEREEVQAFIDEMHEEHGLDRGELEQALAGVEKRQSVIDAISDPAEDREWHEYRPIFLTEERIDQGVAFWKEHEDIIRRASQEFGVDPEILVAIIGIETYYGNRQGSDPVLDSLVTLAFDYPPRGDFFRNELGQLFLLADEEELDIDTLQGSYAGAMGVGQFIPSSYREYAVDFSGSGQRDLFGDWKDAIGSVAHYFQVHGWEKGELVAVPAVLSEHADNAPGADGLDRYSAGELRERGLVFSEGIPDERELMPVRLAQEDGEDWWVGLENFYVITRYNRSPLYAMAAWELAREIALEWEGRH